MNSKHHVKIKNKSHKNRLVLVVRNLELVAVFEIFCAEFWTKRTQTCRLFWNYLNYFINDDLKKEIFFKDLYTLNNSKKENGD